MGGARIALHSLETCIPHRSGHFWLAPAKPQQKQTSTRRRWRPSEAGKTKNARENAMSASPLYILLCSGEHEKLQMAAMLASVAAVSERRVEVFVSMNAILAFIKSVPEDQRFQGGHFSKVMKEKRAPGTISLFRQGRELGDLKMWACAMALDIEGWEISHLEDGLFDGPLGLTKFLSDVETGQFITL
jgi:peroxiredoxin family protein